MRTPAKPPARAFRPAPQPRPTPNLGVLAHDSRALPVAGARRDRDLSVLVDSTLRRALIAPSLAAGRALAVHAATVATTIGGKHGECLQARCTELIAALDRIDAAYAAAEASRIAAASRDRAQQNRTVNPAGWARAQAAIARSRNAHKATR